MCIRDSLAGAETADPVRRARAAVRIRLDPGGEHAGRERDCLLYTSDAADERSSVDLGGRRIIKKQNEDRTRLVQ